MSNLKTDKPEKEVSVKGQFWKGKSEKWWFWEGKSEKGQFWKVEIWKLMILEKKIRKDNSENEKSGKWWFWKRKIR